MTLADKSVPSVSVTYARNGSSTRPNELGMRPMQERAYERRGEQYLLIKSPPASGKSRALMFIALDKLHKQGLRKAPSRVRFRVVRPIVPYLVRIRQPKSLLPMPALEVRQQCSMLSLEAVQFSRFHEDAAWRTPQCLSLIHI